MSALIVDAVYRYYLRSGDPRVSPFIRRMADFFTTEGTVAVYWSDANPIDGQTRVKNLLPYSQAGVHTDGAPLATEGPGEGGAEHRGGSHVDFEHNRDVAAILAKAYRFAADEGRSAEADDYLRAFGDLMRTHLLFETRYFFRPSGPPAGKATFRLSNDRKLNWWYRTSASLDYEIGPKTRLKGTPDRGGPFMTVRLEADRASLAPGQRATIRVVFRNSGTAAATDAEIRMALSNRPSEYAFVAGSASAGGAAGPTSAYWNLGKVAPGRTETRVIRVRRIADDAAPRPGRPLDPLCIAATLCYGAPGDTAPDHIPGKSLSVHGTYQRAAVSNPVLIPR
jgi:hypothetical protein